MQLGVNSLILLVTARLALHYLSKAQYGLWMTTTVIASYIALMDFGFSGAAAAYSLITKIIRSLKNMADLSRQAWRLGCQQAVLIFLGGIGLAFVSGRLLHIPVKLEREFFWLVIGQGGVTAAMFATRFVSILLMANHRFDITNYSGAFSLVVNCGIMWGCFVRGFGVFSLLWGQAAGVVSNLAINWIGCHKLKLFPKRGQWGRPSWEKFSELFAFGRNIFLFTLETNLSTSARLCF